MQVRKKSVREAAAHPIAPVFELFEQFRHRRVIYRTAFAVRDEIALADIGDIGGFIVLGEEEGFADEVLCRGSLARQRSNDFAVGGLGPRRDR